MPAYAFTVRLTPKGGRDRVEGWIAGADGAALLKVRVSAPPEDGKANAALLRVLADWLDVPLSALRIAGGHTARIKRIALDSDRDGLAEKLAVPKGTTHDG